MKIKPEDRYSHIRINQIDKLYSWGTENTTLKQIPTQDLVRFFFIDRENTPPNLMSVLQIFTTLSNHAKKSFMIDDYVAREYAITAILRQIKGVDLMNMHRQIDQNEVLILPPPSSSAKIKIIQKIIAQINSENTVLSEIKLIELLTKKEGMSELDAKNSIEKALQLGAIIRTESGNLSL